MLQGCITMSNGTDFRSKVLGKRFSKYNFLLFSSPPYFKNALAFTFGLLLSRKLSLCGANVLATPCVGERTRVGSKPPQAGGGNFPPSPCPSPPFPPLPPSLALATLAVWVVPMAASFFTLSTHCISNPMPSCIPSIPPVRS